MSENNEKILKRATLEDNEAKQVAGGYRGLSDAGTGVTFTPCKICGKKHTENSPRCCYCNSYCHESADCPDAPPLKHSDIYLDPEKNIWGL